MDPGETFEASNSGASETIPSSVGSLKKGSYCILRGHPVRIVEMHVAKVGKHGAAKAKITGIDIFSGNKYEEIHPTGHNIDVPNISRKEFTLLDIDGEGYISMMDEAGEVRQDLKMQEDDETKKIRGLFDSGATVCVTVLAAMGVEKIVQGKEI